MMIDRMTQFFKRYPKRTEAISSRPRLGQPDETGAEEQEGVNQDLRDKNTIYAWQRTHMANERTFLAWCRTGIALIVFSFVIERFDLLIREMKIFKDHANIVEFALKTRYMSLGTFVLGSVIILMAGGRFFTIRKHINQGSPKFSTAPDIFLLVSVLFTVFSIIVFFYFLI